ncbi:hypothetical protein LJR234_004601 [Mesorhizobium amorphae]|uniref:hypothetical protein n=1 Tax=Mesorhizobium amorphae TaxID=71433 RepID=UPI003ECE9A46
MQNTPVRAAAEGMPKNMTPRERLDFHAREFARAARDIDPLATECWVGDGVGDNPQRYMVIVSHKLGKEA